MREVDGYAFTGHVKPSATVQFVDKADDYFFTHEKPLDAETVLADPSPTTMQRFVEYLSLVLGVPVVDQTDLGAQPIKLRWVIDRKGAVGTGADGYRDALLNSLSTLGIKFQKQKMGREVLIVDGVSKQPAEN